MRQPVPEMDFRKFISILEMRIRLSGGGSSLTMSIDRISCPIPMANNKSAVLMRQSAKEILEWAKVLPQEEQKILNSIMSSHIKNSVNYLKEAQQQAGETSNV